MTTGGVLALLLTVLGLGYLSASTLAITLRGGRGPADPPASRDHVDPAGFPVHPAPRGVLHGRPPRPGRGRIPGSRRRRPGPRHTARVRAAGGGGSF